MNQALHYTLIRHIIDKGYAPGVEELANLLHTTTEKVILALYDLQQYHGVVLHPGEPKAWVVHPFSLAPTNFYIRSGKGEWWGNCAWCSLGAASLLNDNVKITTTIGAETKQIEINIIDGDIVEKNYFVHFPVPMTRAWDNVMYTCSTMLVFENTEQVDKWAEKHNIPKGDIQPIEKIWQLSKKWYGNHLNPKWTKWTVDDAKKIFDELGLKGRIWSLSESNDRF